MKMELVVQNDMLINLFYNNDSKFFVFLGVNWILPKIRLSVIPPVAIYVGASFGSGSMYFSVGAAAGIGVLL